MHNFVFHCPTKILFGRGTIPQIGPETAVFGKKVLLVSGRESARRNGTLDQVLGALTAAGVEVVELNGIRPNPLLSRVREGIALAKNNGVEAVVAVGGGSVMDSAKAIGAGALVTHDVWRFFDGKKSVTKSLPLLTVPTLAASGSEVNSGMVLTNEQTRQKFGTGNRLLRPQVSILDPAVTFTVPPSHSVYGAIDAMTHVLEFYFTAQGEATAIQDRLIEGLVLSIMESTELVLASPDDYEARANLMWCATLAMSGLPSAGLERVGFPMHMIEHSLSALYDVPHGAGLSVVMPGWMAYQAGQEPFKFSRFAERVMGVTEGTPGEKAISGIDRLRSWCSRMGSPVSLAELGVSRNDIPAIADNALALAKIWRLRDYSRDVIEKILVLCY